MTFKKITCALLGAFLAGGCASDRLADFSGTTPAFDIEAYFTGELDAYGVITGRGGGVMRTFAATMHGSWQDGVGTLTESFTFDDGQTMERRWTLTPRPGGGYDATAPDVDGTGSAHANGHALLLQYVLNVPYKDGTISVSVEDWLYLMDNGVVVNRSTMRKFGFRVGEILTTIIKRDG